MTNTSAFLVQKQGKDSSNELTMQEKRHFLTNKKNRSMGNREITMRIKALIDKKEISPSAFAKLIGFSQSNLSKVLRGDRNVPSNLISAICDNLNVSYNWIVTGEGNMLVEEANKEASAVASEKAKGAVPYYGDLPVSAGKQDLATILSNMKPTGWINLPGMPSSIGAFPVVGCSMEPDIKPGDFISIIEVDRWERLDPDKTYMIITNDDRMIKHLSVDDNDDEILWCISPNYPKFKIEKSEIVAIYRVTFHGRLV